MKTVKYVLEIWEEEGKKQLFNFESSNCFPSFKAGDRIDSTGFDPYLDPCEKLEVCAIEYSFVRDKDFPEIHLSVNVGPISQ